MKNIKFKLNYLGFLPAITILVWSVYYTFFIQHQAYDFLAAVASAILTLVVALVTIVGLMWGTNAL